MITIPLLLLCVALVLLLVHAVGRTGFPVWPAVLVIILVLLFPLLR